MAEEVGFAAEGTAGDGTGAGDGGIDTSTDLGSTSTEDAGGNAAIEGGEELPKFLVKVNGKDQEVTLDELTSGYQRQADYTKKTQSVAAERAELAQLRALGEALERDPRTTLMSLAGALGVQFGPAVQQAVEDGDVDPLEILAKEVRQLTATQTAQQQAALTAQQRDAQQRQVVAQIEREITDLQATHGDFDRTALIEFAVANDSPNLSIAYRAWRYEQGEAQRIAEHNRALAAKRGAQVVQGGHNAAPGAVVSGTAGGKPTVREAFAMALAQQQ